MFYTSDKLAALYGLFRNVGTIFTNQRAFYLSRGMISTDPYDIQQYLKNQSECITSM
jgi:hypothetical protein